MPANCGEGLNATDLRARLGFKSLRNLDMGMKLKLIILFAGLFVGLASACSLGSGGSTEIRDDSFVVGHSPRLVVSSDNGRVIVNSGPDRSVSVKATLRKSDDIEYQITQVGDLISLRAKIDNGGIFSFGESPGANIEITTPSNTAVELRSSNGSVEVYGIQQSGTLRTSNGKIVLDNVFGDFDIVTSNGGVSITRAIGSFNVKTTNGRIDFDGELLPGGDNKMTTSNGRVEITLQGTPSIKLDGSTSNGSIDTDHPILVSSPGDQHHLVGTIGTGEAALLVKTSNGSVAIH